MTVRRYVNVEPGCCVYLVEGIMIQLGGRVYRVLSNGVLRECLVQMPTEAVTLNVESLKEGDAPACRLLGQLDVVS